MRCPTMNGPPCQQFSRLYSWSHNAPVKQNRTSFESLTRTNQTKNSLTCYFNFVKLSCPKQVFMKVVPARVHLGTKTSVGCPVPAKKKLSWQYVPIFICAPNFAMHLTLPLFSGLVGILKRKSFVILTRAASWKWETKVWQGTKFWESTLGCFSRVLCCFLHLYQQIPTDTLHG